MTGRPPAHERAREQALRDKYRDDALGRLVRANDKYLREHFYYLPEVAALLLIERQERDAAVRDADTLAEALKDALDYMEKARAGAQLHPEEYFIVRDYARSLLASRAAGQEQA